jgi:hypothetical protein
VYGQSVTFTAAVTVSSPGAGTPTGTVTFKDGTTTLGTGTLNGSGIATFSTSTLSVASHSITAVYGGDTDDLGSTSSALSQVVNKDSTSTGLTSSVNPSTFGQSVTFTATVTASAPGSGTPTGTVTFKDGTSTLGTGTLSGGVATYTTSKLSVGTHSITAIYNGDTNFKTSTSPALTQTVNKKKAPAMAGGPTSSDLSPVALNQPALAPTIAVAGEDILALDAALAGWSSSHESATEQVSVPTSADSTLAQGGPQSTVRANQGSPRSMVIDAGSVDAVIGSSSISALLGTDVTGRPSKKGKLAAFIVSA